MAKKKSDDTDGSFSIIRSMSKVNISEDDIDSDIQLPSDATREFFSKIPSEEMLKSVIETIFDLGDKTGKAKALYDKSHAYIKLWGLYKRTDERRKEKEEARIHGNHVRKVVDDRIKQMEKTMEKKFNMLEKKMDKLFDLVRNANGE